MDLVHDPLLSHRIWMHVGSQKSVKGGGSRSNKNPTVFMDLALEYLVLTGIANHPNRNDAVQLFLPL